MCLDLDRRARKRPMHPNVIGGDSVKIKSGLNLRTLDVENIAVNENDNIENIRGSFLDELEG
jgi:hypothetical protein